MTSFPVDQLAQLPFIKRPPTDGRTVFLLPWFNDHTGQWELWLPVQPDVIGRMAGGEPTLGSYYGSRPVDSARDFPCLLATFIRQHLSFPLVAGILESIEGDFFQFCAILEKYHMIAARRGSGPDATLLFGSELEYLIMVVRSLYDLLQRVSKEAAALVHSLDTERRRVISDLPDSFARVVLNGDNLRTADEIESKFNLPKPLATFYASEGPFFQTLREIRTGIEHHGKSILIVLDLDAGAAIMPTLPPWNRFPIWQASLLRGRNGLGSLRSVFVHLIHEAIAMTSRWTAAYASCIAVPPAITDGLVSFVRHPFGHHLVNLDAMRASPWEREGSRAA